MSDNEEENFAIFGTALDALDEENLPRKKPMTIADQCAYDELGRRRFHGAFTGGFSAGYFNTVGSRDGWRPQQFKSTRKSKAGGVSQKPEDFMDEEDNSEFGIAPMGIRATEDFEEKKKEQKRKRVKESTGPIPGTPVLHCLLEPVRETVGIRILRSMGWKPGQGVGPRLTKREKDKVRKRNEKMKIYTCALPPGLQKKSSGESESEGSDDEYAQILFAPDDFELKRPELKDNNFGLGYVGLDKRPVLSGHVNLFEEPTFSLEEKNKKLSIRGRAFGVGAFEVEDDDIYAQDNMSNYDFTTGPKERTKSRWDKKGANSKNCLEGFIPAKVGLRAKKMYPPPNLPSDYQPIHKERVSRFSPMSEEAKLKLDRQKAKQNQQLNALSRSEIINDNSEKPKSVPVKIIERSLNLAGREKQAERERWLQERDKKSTGMSWLDKLSSTTFVRGEVMGDAQTNVKGLQTFEQASSTAIQSGSRPRFGDSEKQKRFEQFLDFDSDERQVHFPKIQPLNMTAWEREQEFTEFEKAAKICEYLDGKEENQENQVNIDLNSLSGDEQMKAAAKMKMYGPLTRRTQPWQPAKIVCVRFNVAEPSGGCDADPALKGDKKKKKFSIFDAGSWDEVAKFEKPVEPQQVENVPEVKSRILPPPKSDKERIFQENYEKIFGVDLTGENDPNPEIPSTSQQTEEKKDLFKAIFLSSDEEEDQEKDEKSMNDEKVRVALIGGKAAELNVERNTSPPRGIFANVDLDELLQDTPKNPDVVEKKIMDTPNNLEIRKDEIKVEPKKLEDKKESSDSDSDSNDSRDSRKRSRSKKKSKKEKKKHKHKEKRHKSKKKKHKKDKKSKR